MRRTADIRSHWANRALRADFLGDVLLTSSRPDKDFEGAGVSIALVVVGVVAAGLGLMTMHTAFKPLPKPGVPVVISHAPAPVAAEAAWRHPQGARPVAQTVSAPLVDEVPAPQPRVRHAEIVRRAIAAAIDADLRQSRPTPASTPTALTARLSVQQVAKADVPGEKMCKAPDPQVLSAKALQPAMILRYDAKFKGPPLDIEPQAPPSDDTERRIRLSALLADMLNQ